MKAFSVRHKPTFQPEDQPTPAWIVKKIDDLAAKRAEAEEMRNYLGASIIGDKCTRELWYSFRHAGREKIEGRMQRLFERGHREEAVFIDYLRSIGLEVQDRDPVTGKQFRHSDIGGHFGGGRDGRARWGPQYQWFLLEFKGLKNSLYNALEKDGLRKSNPKYYGQMQIYMNAEGLPYGLFCASCKEDDRLYFEWVECISTDAAKLLERAETVIGSQTPPDRLTNDKTDFRCKFCSFYEICHGKAPALKNCRSCKHAEPIEDGQWRCNHQDHEFGTPCEDWQDITK